jgi:hypothetical protein
MLRLVESTHIQKCHTWVKSTYTNVTIENKVNIFKPIANVALSTEATYANVTIKTKSTCANLGRVGQFLKTPFRPNNLSILDSTFSYLHLH